MANTILVKRSAVPGRVPSLSDLALGELGLNTADAKLFARKETGGSASIVELGGSGSSGISGPILQAKQVINTDVTLSAGYNGLSLGTVEIATGSTVEVPANSTWTLAEL
jgi:hypothetical protein